jgi:C-terminal processing protease CtpA/Prc
VQTSRIRRISDWSLARRLRELTGIEAPFDVKLFDAKRNEHVRIRMPGVDFSQLSADWKEKFPQDQPPAESASLRFEDDGAIAILKISRFGGTAGTKARKPLGKFIDQAFGDIDAKKSAALILDLRNNGGGEDALGKLLLSHLVDEPFRYYDDLVVNAMEFSFKKHISNAGGMPTRLFEKRPDGKYRMIKHPNWGEQKPSQPVFPGKVYALINGGSFSTTCEFLSHLHARKRAVFIGEESGGGYYGNTSGGGIRLATPNTKLVVGIPLMTYYLAVPGNHEANHGVVPDYPVHYSIDEVLVGKDKEIELALKTARGK